MSVKSYGTHAFGSATSPYAARGSKNAPSTAGLARRCDSPFSVAGPIFCHVLVEFAYPIRPSRIYRTVPALARRQAAVRVELDPRDQARGYRLMARRDPVGIRLLTRRGNDWSARFPLVVEAVNYLKVRSC